MNPEAGIILVIPIIGLAAICQGGRWHWDPIGSAGPLWLRTPSRHRVLVAMFWFGWGASLIVGLLMLFGLA